MSGENTKQAEIFWSRLGSACLSDQIGEARRSTKVFRLRREPARIRECDMRNTTHATGVWQ